MREWMRWKVGLGLIAGAVWSNALGAQAPAGKGGSGSDVCSLATDAEFQQAQGVDPRIGIIPTRRKRP